jgi:hypothetical protein
MDHRNGRASLGGPQKADTTRAARRFAVAGAACALAAPGLIVCMFVFQTWLLFWIAFVLFAAALLLSIIGAIFSRARLILGITIPSLILSIAGIAWMVLLLMAAADLAREDWRGLTSGRYGLDDSITGNSWDLNP